MKKITFLYGLYVIIFYCFSVSAQDNKSFLQITNPKGQEVFKSGDSVNLQWMGDHKIEYLRVELSVDNGRHWECILNKIPAIVGVRKVNLPEDTINKTAMIKITDVNDSANSDISNTFSIKAKKNDKPKNNIHVLLLGSGDFETAFSSTPNKDTSSSASNSKTLSITNGTIGFIVTDSAKFELSSSISFSAVNDTVVNNYGSSVLIPKKGTGSIALSLRYNPWNVKNKNTFFKMLGFYTNLYVSNGLWGYATKLVPRGIIGQDTAWIRSYIPGNTSTVKTINYAFGLGVSLGFPSVSADEHKSLFKAELSFGYALRTIGGDITSLYDGYAYNHLLGTSQMVFSGFQWNVKLMYDNFSISAGIVHLFQTGGRGDITGLTTSQLLTSIEFRTLIKLFDLNL